MIAVIKMRKTLLLFPLLLSTWLVWNCSSGWAPRSYYEDYVDLDLERNFEFDENIKAEIKRFYGAPYKWGGSTPSGTDCSGMVMTIYKNASNIQLPHNADLMFRTTPKIAVRELAFGDLVFFSGNGGMRATHMGIYIKDGYFVHASSSRGVILSKLKDNPYRKQFIGARRVLKH